MQPARQIPPFNFRFNSHIARLNALSWQLYSTLLSANLNYNSQMSGAKFADRMGTLSRKATPVLPYALLRTNNKIVECASPPSPPSHFLRQVVCKDRRMFVIAMGIPRWEVRNRVKGARPEKDSTAFIGSFHKRGFARIETERGFRLPYLAPFLGLVRSRNRNREPSRSFPRRCPSRRV